MRHQIRTLQVPTNWGTGAFVAVPAANSTAEFNGQNIVSGQPGNKAVYSPRPAAIQSTDIGGPYVQPSSVSPNAFLPSIYTVRVNNSMLFGGSLFRNVAPVPATAIGAVVRNGWFNPVIGGNRVTRAVRPFTQWATYNGGASN